MEPGHPGGLADVEVALGEGPENEDPLELPRRVIEGNTAVNHLLYEISERVTHHERTIQEMEALGRKARGLVEPVSGEQPVGVEVLVARPHDHVFRE